MGEGFVELGLLGLVELELDDSFDAVLAQHGGDADEVAGRSVFAVALGATGQNRFLVFQDGFSHFYDAGRRGVIGAVAEQIDHFDAAVSRSFD